jgi:hypothetical protein
MTPLTATTHKGEVFMKRYPVNKAKSAKQFHHQLNRTKAANVPRTIMRGGWRL